jgi:hypothetical protein
MDPFISGLKRNSGSFVLMGGGKKAPSDPLISLQELPDQHEKDLLIEGKQEYQVIYNCRLKGKAPIIKEAGASYFVSRLIANNYIK